MTDYNSPSYRSYYSYNPGGTLRLHHNVTWTADLFNSATPLAEGTYFNERTNTAGYVRGHGTAYYIAAGRGEDFVPLYVSSIAYKTQYAYRDRSKVYTYYFYKDIDKESTSDPTGQSNVSNVVKWVKYRAK